MIIATLGGGKTIGIGFEHKSVLEYPDPVGLPGFKLEVRYTYCKLFEVPSDYLLRSREDRATLQLEPVAIGAARCSLQDNFKKETGRKVSLTRAVEGLVIGKADKTRIWDAYLNRGKSTPAGVTIH